MNTYFTIKNFLSENECVDILKNGVNNKDLNPATIIGNITNTHIRKSSILFMDKIDFINERLKDVLNENITMKGSYINEIGPYQFTEYKLGDFYDWHTDSDNYMYKNRFCSIVIQLNNEYEGGNLELKKSDDTIYEFERGIGNLFVFFSNILHRVNMVNRGTRYSLVNWISLSEIQGYKKTLL